MTLLPARQGSLTSPQADPAGLATLETDADSGLSLATAISGTPGSGKTTLAAVLALWGLLNGWGQVLLDPTGSLSTAFLHQVLCFVSEFPEGQDKLLWQRVRYLPVGAKPIGAKDVVSCFPIYERRQGENVWEAAERLVRVIELSRPTLVTQSTVTWPRARRLASNAGAVLAALNFELTELAELLFNTLEFEKQGLFETAIARCPEVAPAVSYFREQYLPLSRSDKHQLTSTFLDHVYRFSQDPSLRVLFGGSQGIDWEEPLEAERETVILDCSAITDPETLRFVLLWIFYSSLYPHIKTRGRRPYPLGLLIDEFPALAHKAAEGANPLSDLLDEFLARYARANRVFFTCCFQSLTQLPPDLQQTILRFGNLFVGRAGTMSEARQLADEVLFRTDPYKVKYWHRVWAHEPIINSYTRSIIGTNHFVIDHRPEHMPLSEQTELAAQRIVSLPPFSFFARVATGEGSVSQYVSKIMLRQVTEDPETGAPVFPDETAIRWLKSRLAKRSGRKVADISKEIDSRLATAGTQAFVASDAALDGRGGLTSRRSLTSRLQDMAQPAPHTAKETPSRPTLAEKEQAFLAFLAANPDLPVHQVYKGLGIKAAEVTKIRERLTEQGFLHDLEVRTGRSTAGRPTKWIIPTFAALELLGIEAPKGRGGVIHRHLQQLIAQGATDKGYTAHCEKKLGTGAIVDVHLERAGETVAVEIAVMSHPSRELAHIRQCLDAGYDKVVTVFADPRLLEKTREALGVVFSDAELSRMQLIPISKLAGVG